VLLLGNHISRIDWAVLQIASPRPIKFVMHRDFYERWYLTWFLDLVGAIPIGGRATKSAIKKIEQLLNAGEVVCVFPEGVISRTGHLSEFQRGYETAIANTHNSTQIVPFYLRGLWGSRFSNSSEALSSVGKRALHRDIIVAFGKPLSKETKAEAVKAKVFELSIQSWESYTSNLPSLPEAWIETVKSNGSAMAVAELGAEPISHTRFLTACIAFSRRIKANSPETNVGLLLPSVTGGAIANLAAMLAGKVVVNINYSASVEAQLSAIKKSDIKSIYTSRKFIDKLEQRGIAIQRVLAGSKVLYLEDLKEKIGKLELLTILVAVTLLPADMLKKLFCVHKKVTEPAAILFSSGSEGAPKGIVLSHQNIIANAKQAAEVLNIDADDVLLGCLPLFHAFGLTVGLFVPAVTGIPVAYHPDPTDAINVAKAIKKFNATIFCGTSTFFRLYIRNSRVHPLMLESLRMVIAGAEKLSPDVKQAFQLKFNRELFEGYGVTETAPVASVNIPNKMDSTDYSVQLGNKEGTVGMPLPGTSFRIVDPDSLEELPIGDEGLVVIGGSQVMLGYLNDPEKTDEVIYQQDGIRWYKTGDKGKLDLDGFLTIVDRYSRFAKLAGEMVSLGAVEQTVRDVLADVELEVVAVTMPDPKKGEKVILLVGHGKNADQIRRKMIEHKINPLMIPSDVYEIDEVPKLGSGKTDYGAANKLAVKLVEI
jgi:acyl-[acyl-carrier-protein]-phospholipid O-acyltransferase/long-chain-fatty-acid--[acyl-carrier-protein] ligase